MWSPVACIYGWRSCRVELVREGNEGARMWFLLCLMSHNKERSAWKRCAAKQQHSTVTNLECRVSFRHCWLSLPCFFSLPLMPVRNFQAEKVRRRDAGADTHQMTGFREEAGGMSEWQITLLSVPRQPEQDCIPCLSCLCLCTQITPRNKRLQAQKWQQHSRQQRIRSVVLSALEDCLGSQCKPAQFSC